MQVFRFLCRLVVGGLFVGHGTQKLFGWFGGSGIDGTAKMMESLKLAPPRRNAIAAGVTEAGSGAMLAAGLATPLAASGLIGVMTTAIRTVHWSKGVWNSKGGYEYPLVLIATAATLAESGPGKLSLDHVLGLKLRGTKWALGAVALGVTGSMLTVAAGHRAYAREAASATKSATPAVAATHPDSPTHADAEPTSDAQVKSAVGDDL